MIECDLISLDFNVRICFVVLANFRVQFDLMRPVVDMNILRKDRNFVRVAEQGGHLFKRDVFSLWQGEEAPNNADGA